MTIKIEKRGGPRHKPKAKHCWKGFNCGVRRPIEERVWINYIVEVRYDKKCGNKY